VADHVISISNSLNLFGPAPSTKWGEGSPYTMTWGTSKWGEGTEDLIVSVEKYLGNEITASDAYFKEAAHAVNFGEISSTFEMSSESLLDGSGYYYVFRKPSTDAENQVITTYASGSVASVTWTSGTVSATSWS
jgi:hypothetical protein